MCFLRPLAASHKTLSCVVQQTLHVCQTMGACFCTGAAANYGAALQLLNGSYCAAGGALSPNAVLSPKAQQAQQPLEFLQAAGEAPQADSHEPPAALENNSGHDGVPPMGNAPHPAVPRSPAAEETPAADSRAPPMTHVEAQVWMSGPLKNIIQPDNVLALDIRLMRSAAPDCR